VSAEWRHRDTIECGLPLHEPGTNERPSWDGVCGYTERDAVHDLYPDVLRRDRLPILMTEANRHSFVPGEARGICEGCREDWPCDAEKMRVERDELHQQASNWFHEYNAAIRRAENVADALAISTVSGNPVVGGDRHSPRCPPFPREPEAARGGPMNAEPEHDWACGRYAGHPDPLCAECQLEMGRKRITMIVTNRWRGKPRRQR